VIKLKYTGKAFKFGDDINTDYVISAKYKSKITDFEVLAHYLMDDIRPGFYDELSKGDILVGGKNFGCGSSRETAPIVIKQAGISAVLAKSFARIFYRNSINIGLPVIVCDTDLINEGDRLTVDLGQGKVTIERNNTELSIPPYPEQIREILACGGLKGYLLSKGR
jgi:3-isopropylmalate/(R)-2-methylmalate dehydratase small subunit